MLIRWPRLPCIGSIMRLQWLALVITGLIVLSYSRTFIFHSNPPKMFVSSAYFIPFASTELTEGRINMARMLTLAERSIEDVQLFCRSDKHRSSAVIRRTDEAADCAIAAFTIDCPVESVPRYFALYGDSEEFHELELVKTDRQSRELVVCVTPMSLFEDWQLALAAIELYRLHGASLLVLPIDSVLDELFALFRAYERAGVVRTKRAVELPPQMSHLLNPHDRDASTTSGHVRWLSTRLAYRECFYEYRESARFILNVDIEDVLVPRTTTSLVDVFSGLVTRLPSGGAFEFVVAPTFVRAAHTPSQLSIEHMARNHHIGAVAEGKQQQVGRQGTAPTLLLPGRIRRPPRDDEKITTTRKTVDIEPDKDSKIDVKKERRVESAIVEGYEYIRLGESDSIALRLQAVEEMTSASSSSPSLDYIATRHIYNDTDTHLQALLAGSQNAALAFQRLPPQPVVSTAASTVKTRTQRGCCSTADGACGHLLVCASGTRRAAKACFVEMDNRFNASKYIPNAVVINAHMAPFRLQTTCYMP